MIATMSRPSFMVHLLYVVSNAKVMGATLTPVPFCTSRWLNSHSLIDNHAKEHIGVDSDTHEWEGMEDIGNN